MNNEITPAVVYGTNGFTFEYAGGRLSRRPVPLPVPPPPSAGPVNSAENVEKMAVAGKAIAAALSAAQTAVQQGERSTLALEELAQAVLAQHGCKPSFQGYQPPFSTEPYAFATCISVNAEVVHGMPSAAKILAEGDIVTVDLGANFEGWHADAAISFGVGPINSAANNLLVTTKNALKEGVKKARVGHTIGDVSRAVYEYSIRHGFRPALGLTGHFIGQSVHMDPSVPNVPPHPLAYDMPLVAGMTFCIEPMLCIGSAEVDVDADRWTIRTKDGGLSAHFEHTVHVEPKGAPARVLTRTA